MLKNPLKGLFVLFGLWCIFVTTIEFMYFLSYPSQVHNPKPENDRNDTSIVYRLLTNIILLDLFMLQHSLMKTTKLNEFFKTYHIDDIQRSFYVICTALTFHMITTYWQPIRDVTFWSIDCNQPNVWWLVVTIHCTAWLLIYVGCLCKDIGELLGVKQVYYKALKLPDPNHWKSHQLQRLNDHIRHPSFLGFLVIFWANTCMSLDRLVLAILLSSYMYLAWRPDRDDYAYQVDQYKRKFHDLDRLRTMDERIQNNGYKP